MKIATQPSHAHTKRVLLAEDSSITQDILRVAMASSGHELCVATDARQALKFLQEQTFDVALIDYNLPDKNGVELVREFFKTHQHQTVPRIVALTGDAAEVEDLEESECNFDLVVAKPFLLSDLIDLINSEDSIARNFEATRNFEPRDERRPIPIIPDDHRFHFIYYPYDFVSSFKNAVSMSIARNGAADAIIFDEIPNLKDREMLCKIKGLGMAAHIDRTQAMRHETDFSTYPNELSEAEQYSNIMKLLEDRKELRANIYPSHHFSKDIEINLMINLSLKGTSLVPRINFRDASGILYNHLLPSTELETICNHLIADDLLDQKSAIQIVLCPKCDSARLYPQHLNEITERQKLPLLCTDCQTPFLPVEANNRTVFEFSLTDKAKALLRQAPQEI